MSAWTTCRSCWRRTGPGLVPVAPAYLTSAGPTVPGALAALREAGHRRIAVAAHLPAPGRSTRALADVGAWAVTDPPADHPRIARLVLDRYESQESARGTRVPRAARLACRQARLCCAGRYDVRTDDRPQPP
ncbi:sirohydrochlorin chelatase [Streptomyces sp. NPDC058623]|uniref:sirohydrochlorin chelatase n=1 Tax=Streptomyces sp. NPDC058623 TaxID=3346563 RepID=UPI00364A676D